MRASEGSEPAKADCEDPIIKAACLLDSDECPAECKGESKDDEDKTVVKSGDLAMTAEAADGKNVIANGATSYLDTLTFKASEDITLNSVTLERYGYSTYADVDSIWLEDEEGNVISSEKGLSKSKDSVTLSIKKEYRNIKNKDEITIAIKTTAAGDFEEDEVHGTNIGFKVTDVDSSAKSVNLDDYKAHLYDIIDYKGSAAKVELQGKDGKNYNVASGESYEVAKVKVTATNSALAVNGFTLTNDGDLDLSDNIENVTVKAGGNEVKGLTYTIKKDTLKVNFNTVDIAINKNVQFTVYVTLKDDFEDYNDDVTFYIDGESDLKATESKNGTTVKFMEGSKYEKGDAKTYTFIGGKITLSNKKLSATIDAAAGSENVVIAEGSVKLGGEPINIKKLTITPSVKEGLDVKDIVSSIKVFVDDEEFEAGKDWLIKDILIEKDATIKVVVNLEDDSDGDFAGETISFNIEGTASINATTLDTVNENVKYDNSKEPVAKTNLAGSISLSKIKVNESKASLKNSTSTEAEFVLGQTTKKTIFDGTYTAKKSDLDLNEVALMATEADKPVFAETDNVTFYLQINGKDVATLDYDDILAKDELDNIADGDYVDFSDINVEAGESVKVKVIAEIMADDTAAENERQNVEQKLRLILRGTDSNNAKAGRGDATTVKLKITDSESIKVADVDAAKKTVLLQDSDVVLAKFRVKPSNTDDDIDLTKLVLTFENFDDLKADNIEITVDDDPVSIDDEDFDGNDLELNDISYPVPSAGVVVEVRYTDELAASVSADAPYKITLSKVNTSTPKTLFTRYVVPALITLGNKCADSDCDTTIFSIEKIETANSNITVSDLLLTFEGVTDPVGLEDVAEGNTIEVNGYTASAEFVTAISYKAGGDIEILKKDYNDYFKVGSSYLKIFKAK